MNESIRDKRLSTADLVARGERPGEAVEERVGERVGDEDTGDRMSEPMAPQPMTPRDAYRDTRIDERVAHAVPAGQSDEEPAAALFEAGAARDFRQRWDDIQISFVDDPERAVRQADELVAQVMSSLAETFAAQRSELERYVTSDSNASTERRRVALRRYRSFFQRLLTL